ncbi:hypothetical protein ACUIJN_17010 [Metabacillus halosaccharovorans]|uniref:hypothetical protein n=1 Tax=Metabacillus halosaccharovorans TaxID=930124 RepID=UPI00403E2528
MSTNIKDSYTEAIRDLKEVNDQLFYTDLKGTMEAHLTRMYDEFKRVEEKAAEITSQMEVIDQEFSYLISDVNTKLTVTMSNLEEKLPEIFKDHKQELFNAYKLFSKVANDQQDFLQAKNSEWKELAKEVKGKLEDELATTKDKLKQEISNKVNELKVYLKEQQQQFSQSMETTNAEQKQSLHSLETSFNESVVLMNEKLTRLTNEITVLGIEGKAVYEQSIQRMESVLQAEFNKQQQQIQALEKSQQQNTDTMKKWFIGIVVSQVLVVGGVIGLYFL